MDKKNWLLVANSSLARVYEFLKKNELKELSTLEHPESRLHNLDLVSDKPGRDFESGGTRRHALEAKTSPKKLEFASFAKFLADFLEKAHNEGKFDALYIAANPSLLGLLRQSLHPNIAKLIKGETDKDLTQFKAHEIPTHLQFFF
jgi:protein required for attachment to host cells